MVTSQYIGGSGHGPDEHQPDTKCNSYCHLYVHYIILTKLDLVISIFIYFLILVSRPPPPSTRSGVGSGQGPNEHQPDTKCNSYCHLYVHYIILTKLDLVISIFIYFLILVSRPPPPPPPGRELGVVRGPMNTSLIQNAILSAIYMFTILFSQNLGVLCGRVGWRPD